MKTSDEVRSFTVAADDDGIRVDRWFKRHLPQVGFGTVSKWARTGQVRVDGKRVKPDDRLAEGQQIRVPPGGDAPHKKDKPKRELSKAELEQAEGMVIEKTKGALVLNKPPPEGLPCEVFDPERLRQSGAVALTLTPDGLQVKTTRDRAGRRLWNDEDMRAERWWSGHGNAR